MLRFVSAVLIGVMAQAVTAKTFDLPHPTITVSIPDKWPAKPIEDGVEASSPDDEVYVSVEVYDTNDTDETIAEGIRGIAEENVQIDPKATRREDVEVNGLSGVQVTGKGRDKDGPITLILRVFDITRGKSVLVTVWGTPNGISSNQAGLATIVKSLKRPEAGR